MPGYGTGPPITTGDVRRLAASVRLQVHRARGEMDSPAVLLPPLNGHPRLVVAHHVRPEVVKHVTLHEIGHVLFGDADELTFMTWGGPLPPNEDWADLFSLVALLDDLELEEGRGYVEARIRDLVPLDDYGWVTYRVPRLAGKVGRVKERLREEGSS